MVPASPLGILCLCTLACHAVGFAANPSSTPGVAAAVEAYDDAVSLLQVSMAQEAEAHGNVKKLRDVQTQVASTMLEDLVEEVEEASSRVDAQDESAENGSLVKTKKVPAETAENVHREEELTRYGLTAGDAQAAMDLLEQHRFRAANFSRNAGLHIDEVLFYQQQAADAQAHARALAAAAAADQARAQKLSEEAQKVRGQVYLALKSEVEDYTESVLSLRRAQEQAAKVLEELQQADLDAPRARAEVHTSA